MKKNIKRYLLICLFIPFFWFLGQLIGHLFIELLRIIRLDDNFIRFLDAVSIF